MNIKQEVNSLLKFIESLIHLIFTTCVAVQDSLKPVSTSYKIILIVFQIIKI